MNQSDKTRRRFLRTVGGFGLAPFCSRIDLGAWLQAERRFSGDNVDEGHRLLMDPEGVLAASPREPHPEPYDVVIVGAGVSGLAAAYLLRGLNTLLLEREAEPGGVSRLESWNGIEYAIGAAYVIDPDPDSDDAREKRTFQLLEELGLRSAGEDLSSDRSRSRRLGGDANHCVFSRRRVVPEREVYSAQNVRFFKAVLDSDHYPAVPPQNAGLVTALDRVSFREFLKAPALQRAWYGRTVGAISPLGWEAIEYYCWGAFAATAAETSAYHGLNFFAAEFGDILIYPGGNGFITRRLAERIGREKPGTLRTGSYVLRIEREAAGGFQVLAYQGGRVHDFRARAVIFAAPLFLAARVVPSLPAAQREAIAQLNYRAYAVGNVLLRRPIDRIFRHAAFRNGYELTPVHGAGVDAADTRALSARKVFSDAVVADFPIWRHRDRGVLTVYRPYPYEGGRADLLSTEYRDLEGEVRRAVLEMFAPHGLETRDIEDVRLARWGHPMIVARPGQLADGLLRRAAAPADGLHFAHTDVNGAPAFENAMAAVFDAVDGLARERS